MLHILAHPLGASLLTTLRDRATAPPEFRAALHRLALLLATEASRGWETARTDTATPLGKCDGAQLARPVILVPILRAGLGLQEGVRPLLPHASTGHIGLYRDPATLRPVEYYRRLPADLAGAQVLLLDPMLATGHSAVAALDLLKNAGATRLQFICVLACPPGLAEVARAHPDVPILAAAVDPELDSHGYILPGLGDAGDRYFGTA